MTFSLHNVSIIRQGIALLDGISLVLPAGGNLLVTGPSGSGKTLLLQALAGKVFYQGKIEWQTAGKPLEITFVEQHYFFKNKSNTNNFYYQQRFNSADADDAETLMEGLAKQPRYEEATVHELLQNFGMESLKNASLLQFSSGEHKRFQLIKALLRQPEVLLLDEPYLGLDISSRKYLNGVMNDLAAKGCTIISVSTLQDTAECFTHVLQLENGKAVFFGEKTQLKQHTIQCNPAINKLAFDFADQSKCSATAETASFTTAVAMQNVTIRYGDKTILHNIDWQVKAGEKWLLKGPNGAGKSTLISLITGDNPQAFANDIVLFDRKKGSGESIWDIKKHIGYISPELQWHFDAATTCRQAVGSGFFDTIGLFRKLSQQQEETIRFWLQQFELEAFADKTLRTLPVSKQKLVLLARAMVKNPPMLILDEPGQGLDEQQKAHFLQIIKALCTPERTLLYVSHYASEVPDCIEQVIELEKGEATICRLTPTPLFRHGGQALTERCKTTEAKNRF